MSVPLGGLVRADAAGAAAGRRWRSGPSGWAPRCASWPTRAPTATSTWRSPPSWLATDALIVAPAITNPFSRHPVTTAAAIATLAEFAPGRVWNGLGVGGSRVLEPLGLAPAAAVHGARATRSTPTGALLAARPWARRRCRGHARAGAGGHRRTRAAGAGASPPREADWVILSAKPLAHLAAEAARDPRRRFGPHRLVGVRRLVRRRARPGAAPLLVHGARRPARHPGRRRARRRHRWPP